MFIHDELTRRGVPDLLTHANGIKITGPDNWELRRSELIEILAREEYGYMPPPAPVTYEIISHNKNEYGGKVQYYAVRLTIATPDSEFSFMLNVFLPKSDKKRPLLLHIAFRRDLPDKYMPVEEITDRGFALASFCYTDVASDSNDGFAGGIAGLYDRRKYNWGKISMWAWAASRALDYLLTLPEIDTEYVAVIGHSRLGKTALWCGANDTRVKFVISNNSGCSGSAVTRDKTGERVKEITKNFPYWFCSNYKTYIDNEHEMPFDQHFLIAACAPRRVLIGCAKEDSWADPFSEYLAAHAASDAYTLLNMNGLTGEDREPAAGDTFHEGNIGYHLRSGGHFLSRYDWNKYMDFILSK
ncbi:MAG: alpha/beta hydrolase [Eubacteriales bacterium]|nr:alpha/beta hydrolase [Eubacteriales bacterium]